MNVRFQPISELSLSMPRYFFHVELEGERLVDPEGSDLLEMESLLPLARWAAADLAADDLKRGTLDVEQFNVVENESGQNVDRVRVVAQLEVLAPRSLSQSS